MPTPIARHIPTRLASDRPQGQGRGRLAWCLRCDHPNDPDAGYTLTVHHLDMNRSNCRWWNIPALCQRCHLRIQARVLMYRPWLWDHSDWFKPFVSGYYAFHFGLPDDRSSVLERMDESSR